MPKAKGQDTYQRRGWLKAQLDKHGTYTAVSKATGIPAPTLNKWGIKHGLSLRPRIDPTVKRRVIKLLDKGYTYEQISRRVFISPATISRIASNLVPKEKR